jgi:hypothetical protein
MRGALFGAAVVRQRQAEADDARRARTGFASYLPGTRAFRRSHGPLAVSDGPERRAGEMARFFIRIARGFV